MAFPSINSPSEPEEFSWRVILGKEQELVQLDEQRAEVIYPDDGTVAASIAAEAAHDAVGTEVPTSLSVSEGDVITLTVHHRVGNPSAGEPFVYPVVAGKGWEGGFETVFVQGPPADPPAEVEGAQPPASSLPPARGQVGGPPRFKLGPPDEGRRTSSPLVFGIGTTIDGPVELVAYGWEAEADSPPASFCVLLQHVRQRRNEFGVCGNPLGQRRSGPIAIDMDVQTVKPKASRATAVGGRVSPSVAAVRLFFHRPGSRKLRHATAIVGQVAGDLQQRLRQQAPFGFYYATVRGIVRFGRFRAQALDASGRVIGIAGGSTATYRR